MKIAKNSPAEFAFNEICTSCIQAGIARLKNVYREKDADKRKKWRKKVRDVLQSELERGFVENNIERIENFRDKTSDPVLNDKKLTFGVAQKILNLFLKYCWSLGWIAKNPPDCPVDSRILNEIKWKGLVWSKITRKDYNEVMQIVDKVRQNQSRAIWELERWESLH